MTIDPDLVPSGIGVIAGVAGLVAAQFGRRKAFNQRNEELAAANEHLTRHFDLVDQFLHCEPPSEVIASMLQMLRLLHEPKYKPAYAVMVESNDIPNGTEGIPLPLPSVTDENMHMYALYVEAAVEGILAFNKRWPRYAKIWEKALPNLVSQPEVTVASLTRRAERFVVHQTVNLAPGFTA